MLLDGPGMCHFPQGDKTRHRARGIQFPAQGTGLSLDRGGGSQHATVKHARQAHIGGVKRRAGDDPAPLDDCRAGSDQASGAKAAQLERRTGVTRT